MEKNKDYKKTYTNPEFANVRYRSTAKQSIQGWAYIMTSDHGYVYDLAKNNAVEIGNGKHWQKFTARCGILPILRLPQYEHPASKLPSMVHPEHCPHTGMIKEQELVMYSDDFIEEYGYTLDESGCIK